MKKKWIVLGLSAFFVCAVLGFGAKIYGVSNDITRSEMESYNTLQNRQSIAEKVLTATGRLEQFSPEEVQNVNVFYGDLMGDQRQEAVVAVEFTPKNTIVAVYTPEGDTFRYVGDLGEFFYIRSVQFMPIRSEGKNAVVLREYADQHIGAYERSSFIKGYLYDGEAFKQVLNVPEGIQASWNTLWDNGTQENSEWRRVDQRTDITWENGDYPVLKLVSNQWYSVSTDKSTKNIPEDRTFSVQDRRIVAENYYWSGDWHRFILSEKIDKQTGEKVAVIEDFASSPYAILPEFGANSDKYRIIRQDGTTAVVEKDSLRDATEKDTNAFIHKTL